MKKLASAIILIFILLFFIVSTALGLWFLQGGDLSDIKNGCYNSNGCEEEQYP